MSTAAKQLKKNKKNAEKQVQKEERWLLAEENFLEKFKDKIDEILHLNSELTALNSLSDNQEKVHLLQGLVKKDLKIIRKLQRKIGRRERRRIRYERRVLGKIALMQKDLTAIREDNIKELIEQIHIYSGRILSEVSAHTGRISKLMNEKTPDLNQIAKHTEFVLQSAKALIVLLESFEKLIKSCEDYHNNEDFLGVVRIHCPKLRLKILAGKAPLFYYHGTKPQFVKSIFKSGILAPEMRLKIRDKTKFDLKLAEEVRLFMRMRRTPTMNKLRKDYLIFPGIFHEEKFDPITTSVYRSSDATKLQKEMFPSNVVVTNKAFYPYFDDDLKDLFFKKYEKFYVKKQQPEQFEHLSSKINKLVEKRIQVIYEICKSKNIPNKLTEEYVLLIRKAYAVIPHFEYINGAVDIKKEDRAGASGSYRWIVRKDRWFLYFAAEPPYELYIRYSNLARWFLVNEERACIFEFKPTLYSKIDWKFMGDNLYTGELQYDIVSTGIISLAQYCSRIYCNPWDIDFFKQLVKKHNLPIKVHSANKQKEIYEKTFAALKG